MRSTDPTAVKAQFEELFRQQCESFLPYSLPPEGYMMPLWLWCDLLNRCVSPLVYSLLGVEPSGRPVEGRPSKSED
jgi:hypothetical protein